jgi:hypothetical protein
MHLGNRLLHEPSAEHYPVASTDYLPRVQESFAARYPPKSRVETKAPAVPDSLRSFARIGRYEPRELETMKARLGAP